MTIVVTGPGVVVVVGVSPGGISVGASVVVGVVVVVVVVVRRVVVGVGRALVLGTQYSGFGTKPGGATGGGGGGGGGA